MTNDPVQITKDGSNALRRSSFARREIAPGITLDARRCVFLSETKTLVIADLHFGYAWAQRHSGNLLPLSAEENAAARIGALAEDYAAREIVLLGDVVHRAVLVDALKAGLMEFARALSERAVLKMILGNHDRGLEKLLAACGLNVELMSELRRGLHLLTHGDSADFARAQILREEARERGGRVIIGHEHPAITISDGVATSVKCPCFLLGERVLVLPAFSDWAAGANNARSRRFMSPLARGEVFKQAFAVLANKLLPVRL